MFVSIGADCQPAHHTRRLTDIQTLRFFDWVGSPAKSVKSLIESRFDQCFHPDYSRWETRANKHVLYDGRYNIWFEHHNGEANESAKVGLWKHFSALARHFIRIMEEDSPICFVKRLHQWDGPDGVAQAEELARMILAMRPNSVFLSLREKPDRQPEICGRYIDAFNWDFFESWAGSPDLYEENFVTAYKVMESMNENDAHKKLEISE
jgi:hypothetical protein